MTSELEAETRFHAQPGQTSQSGTADGGRGRAGLSGPAPRYLCRSVWIRQGATASQLTWKPFFFYCSRQTDFTVHAILTNCLVHVRARLSHSS